jgi:hypothetical protein
MKRKKMVCHRNNNKTNDSSNHHMKRKQRHYYYYNNNNNNQQLLYILSIVAIIFALFISPTYSQVVEEEKRPQPPAEEVTARNADTSSYTNILKQLEQPTGAAATKASTDGVKEEKQIPNTKPDIASPDNNILTYGHNKFDYAKLQKILRDKTEDFQMKFLPGRVNVKLGKVTLDALKGHRRSEDIGATGEEINNIFDQNSNSKNNKQTNGNGISSTSRVFGIDVNEKHVHHLFKGAITGMEQQQDVANLATGPMDATALESVASESKSPQVVALKEQVEDAKFELAKIPIDDLENPSYVEAKKKYDDALGRLQASLMPTGPSSSSSSSFAQPPTGATGNTNYINFDAPTGSVNNKNNEMIHNSATYRVLKPSILPFGPTGTRNGEGALLDATGLLIAKKRHVQLLKDIEILKDESEMLKKSKRMNEVKVRQLQMEELKQKVVNVEKMIQDATGGATGGTSTGGGGGGNDDDSMYFTSTSTGNSNGKKKKKREEEKKKKKIPSATGTEATTTTLTPTTTCDECKCDKETDQVQYEEVHGHKYCYCTSANFITKRRRCLGPLPTNRPTACEACVCAADEQPFGQVHTFKTFGGTNACLCAGKVSVGRSKICSGELPTAYEKTMDCSLAKCSGDPGQRIVYQALGDVNRYYCMDVRTNNPITEPKHCKGFINAKKLCTTCTCNPNGRAPELVYERMNGNNICYCKGADGNTISEVCHGPLPNGNVAPSNIAPRTESNHLMATMYGNKKYVHYQKHLSMESKSAIQRLRQALNILIDNNASFQEMLNVMKSLSHQVKADKNSADLIHSLDAKGCGHSIAEYSAEVKQALERKQQCIAAVKEREVESNSAKKEFIKLVDMDKFGKGKIADIKRREKALSKIEQAEMASEFATKASEKIYKTTMNALMGNVQEGLKNSDPSIDEDLKTKPKSSTTIATKVVQQEPSSFLEKKENIVESDILIKQESQTVDKVLNSIAKRKKRRRNNNNMRSSNGGKKK